MLQKSLSIIAIAAFLSLPFLGFGKVVNAQAQDAVNFNTLQQALLKIVDASLARLNALESKVSSNQYLTAATKQAALDLLNDVETELRAYKAQIQTATTTAQLQAASKQLTQYLKDNKDVIRQVVQMVVTDLANQIPAIVAEFEQKVQQALTALKIACPSEIATINEIEAQLARLETELKELAAAVQAKNTTLMKQEITQISQLSKEIVVNLQELEAACL